MNTGIAAYHEARSPLDRAICERLAAAISEALPESEGRIWHAHPVWFLAGNPVVGYSRLKAGMRLMFWSGASFDEPRLTPGTGKFKDASILYPSVDEINTDDLARWLVKARLIQWDYAGVVKRAGRLEKLGTW
jgi:hypothetical protein